MVVYTTVRRTLTGLSYIHGRIILLTLQVHNVRRIINLRCRYRTVRLHTTNTTDITNTNLEKGRDLLLRTRKEFIREYCSSNPFLAKASNLPRIRQVTMSRMASAYGTVWGKCWGRGRGGDGMRRDNRGYWIHGILEYILSRLASCTLEKLLSLLSVWTW